MKKYIFTESQIKSIVNNLLKEQSAFDNRYNNQTVSEQMKTIKPDPHGKYCFSAAKLIELDKSRDNKLYKVIKGDTISGIVKKLGANSISNILDDNDLLENVPTNLKVGDVIVYSSRPTGI